MEQIKVILLTLMGDGVTGQIRYSLPEDMKKGSLIGSVAQDLGLDLKRLCRDVTPCCLSFDLILENPIELHRVTVEILDINDNTPFS